MRFFTIIIFIGLTTLLQAQKEHFNPKLYADFAPNQGLSYWGEFLFHPGLKIMYDLPFKTWGVKITNKKQKVKYRVQQLFAAPHLGYFIHPGNHQGLAIGTDFGYRLHLAKKNDNYWYGKGFVFEVFLNADYMLQINSAATYSLDTDGNAIPVSGLRSYFLAGSGLGFGYSFAKPKMVIMLRPNLSWQMPYDAIILPRGFVELGVLFRLNLPKKN